MHFGRKGTAGRTGRYDAFISYSHAEDDALAAALQAGLERFARPWYRPRMLRVFRDTTNLTATPGLWSEIERALAASDWFVLVASPKAAASDWVGQEVAWWLSHKDRSHFLIAVSDGNVSWGGADFDWRFTNALPWNLSGAFTEEPRWVNLRGIRRKLTGLDDAAARRHGRRRLRPGRLRDQVGDWVADLAAPIRGSDKDSLVGEHLRYQRRTRRTVQSVIAVLAALTLAASAAAVVAVQQRDRATTQSRISTARQLAALSATLLSHHIDLAQLFAAEAYHLDQDPQTRSALFQAVTAAPHLVNDLQASGPVSVVAGAGDQQVIVAGLTDGRVLRWRLPSTRPAVIASLHGPVTDVGVSNGGNVVAAITKRNAVIWSLGNGAKSLHLNPAQENTSTAVSSSGHFIAISAGLPNASHYGVSLVTSGARLLRQAQVYEMPVSPDYMAFDGDSSLITLNGSYGVWSRLSVSDLSRTTGYNTAFGTYDFDSALSPDGRFFSYSNATHTLPIWTTDGAPTIIHAATFHAPTGGRPYPSALAISEDGKRIAQADAGTIYVSRISPGPTGTAGRVLQLSGNDTIKSGDLTFFGHGDQKILSATGSLISIWNLAQYSRIGSATHIYAPAGCTSCSGPSISVSPDGRQVAVLDSNGNAVAVKAIAPSPGLGTVIHGEVGPPLWSPDSKTLMIINGTNGNIDLHAARPGFPVVHTWFSSAGRSAALTYGQPDHPVSLSMLPSGTIMEVDQSGRTIYRDGKTGRVERIAAGIKGIAAQSYGQNFATADPAGQEVAQVSGFSSRVHVISTASGHIRMLSGTGGPVGFNGEQLLVQRPDGALQVWSSDGNKLIKSIPVNSGDATGPVGNNHGMVVESLANGTTVLIDLSSGQTVGSLRLPAGIKFASPGLAFSRDGSRLITVTSGNFGSGAAELISWSMSASAWMRAACQAAGHPITAAEWREFVGTAPPASQACG